MLSAGGQTVVESRNKGKCLYQERLNILDTGIIFKLPLVCWEHTARVGNYAGMPVQTTDVRSAYFNTSSSSGK